MPGLADQTTPSLLASIGDPNQVPAAGVACALACATAAALVELTAALAARRVDDGAALRAVAERGEELRATALAAADEDAATYAAVLEADGADARAAALDRASEPPLAIAEAAAEIAEAAAQVLDAGEWPFTPDAAVAVELAATAARGAAVLVAANLSAAAPGDRRLVRARAAAERAEAARGGR